MYARSKPPLHAERVSVDHYLEEVGQASGAAWQVARTGAHILFSARAAQTRHRVRREVRAQLYRRGAGLRALRR